MLKRLWCTRHRASGTTGHSRYAVVPRGCGSVVEHHLAKVRVAGSNPVIRSKDVGPLFMGAFVVSEGGSDGSVWCARRGSERHS